MMLIVCIEWSTGLILYEVDPRYYRIETDTCMKVK